jgi:CheY-like chemotaxis protein
LARKILLADDSVTAQNMGRKSLTDAGYEVVTVNNGSAALKKIAEGKPDLIVLDVYMPGYSGLEVCQRIKENRETARIPILLTVGKLEPFKPEEARRARADAFVVKPFEASELLSALSKLEDKIIPGAEPYKQGRFAKAVASVDQEPDGERFGDSEGGWKARLRIPTGKPKERDPEPDPDYAATQGKGFRDLAEPSAKKNALSTPPPAPTLPERPLPAGIPHDITPEEIAAITAAAAQLDGAATAAPVDSPEIQAAESAITENAADAVAQDNAPVTFARSPALTESADVQTAAVAPMDLPQPEAVAEAAHVETVTTGSEALPEVASIPVPDAQAIAEEPATPAVIPSEESSAQASAELYSVPPAAAEERPTRVPEMPEVAAVEVPDAPAPAAVPEVAAPQPAAASASDDEVMAALQTLIPSSESAGIVATDPSNGSGTAYPAHSAHPRWIAEEVSLAVGEATISLESEMASAYSRYSGQAAHSAETESRHAAVAQPRSTFGSTIARRRSSSPVGTGLSRGCGRVERLPIQRHCQASPEFSITERTAGNLAARLPK